MPIRYPHAPAAFINAIADEGTKAEAIKHLQATWNELVVVRAALRDVFALIDTGHLLRNQNEDHPAVTHRLWKARQAL